MGVSIREHPKAGKLAMYKSEPGIYLNMFGQQVSELVAREAGFDTAAHRRARTRGEKLAEATALIEQELAAPTPKTAVEVVSRGGFRIMDVGFSRYMLETSEGDPVTPRALTLPVAQSLLDKLAPEAASASAAV
jgi:hypothetical protein